MVTYNYFNNLYNVKQYITYETKWTISNLKGHLRLKENTSHRIIKIVHMYIQLCIMNMLNTPSSYNFIIS